MRGDELERTARRAVVTGLADIRAYAQLLWLPSDKDTERRNKAFLSLLHGSQHGSSKIQVRSLAQTRGHQQQWRWGPHMALRLWPLISSFGEGLLAHVRHLRHFQKSGVGRDFVET